MEQTSTLILAGIIAIIYPLYHLAFYKKVNLNIKSDDKYRLVDYKQTIFIFWALTILIVANYWVYQEPNLNFYPKMNIINGVLIVLILGLTYFQNKASVITSENAEDLKTKLKDIYHYLPGTKKELNWFMFLSISAGFCEEVIFRMFLFEFFSYYVHIILAIIGSNILFAVTHIATGKKNLISSFILGLLFSGIYYYTENIWVAVLLHTAIDVNSGILGYRLKRSFTNK